MKKKKILDELEKVQLMAKEYGVMKTMNQLGYVSVASYYSWRKNNKIPHWAKERINALFKEKDIENH